MRVAGLYELNIIKQMRVTGLYELNKSHVQWQEEGRGGASQPYNLATVGASTL